VENNGKRIEFYRVRILLGKYQSDGRYLSNKSDRRYEFKLFPYVSRTCVVQMKSTAFYKNPQHKSARQRHGKIVSRALALDFLIWQ